MIEVKLLTIINSIDVLKELSDSPIKGRTAYHVAKLLKKVEEELSLFNEGRTKLINTYSEKDENDNPIIENNSYKILPTKVNEFNEEIASLLNTVVSIDAEPIPLEDLENIEIAPSKIILIEDFIQE